jgi:hypothetical protein
MAITSEDILTLLSELEQGDPLDMEHIPIADDAARRLVALSLAKLSADLERQGMPPVAREALALSATARVMLDNMVLSYRLLSAAGAPPDVEGLLKAIAQRAGASR